jgi:hypothetical protein
MELDLLEGLPEELAACFLLPTREMGWCCPCVNSIGSGRLLKLYPTART